MRCFRLIGLLSPFFSLFPFVFLSPLSVLPAGQVRWWVEQVASALDVTDKMIHAMVGLTQPEPLF
jgi:hypothetical protein